MEHLPPAPPSSESPAAAHPSLTTFPETGEADPSPPAAQTATPATGLVEQPANVVLSPRAATQEVVFVPLAVNVGDGFKFGCGFFLALVLAMLIGFVLIAALFVLTSLFGLNLPITR
jgi:hypothetical protein